MQFRIRHLFPLSMALTVGLVACKRDTTGTTSTTSGEQPGSADNAAQGPAAPGAKPREGAQPGREATQPGREGAPGHEVAPGRIGTRQGEANHDKLISRLATARCSQAQRCNHVGQGKKFANGDACMKEMHAQGLSETYRRQCPGTIDEQRLDKCVSAIKASACNGPEGLDAISGCDVTSLCPSMNNP